MRSLNPRPARFAPLAFKSLVALAFALPGLVSAQNLLELYNAARAYDATYLAARALAESAEFRAAQAEALNLPSANVTAGATSEVIDVPTIGTGDSNTVQTALNARYALFNRANQSTVEQARKSLEVAKADLETVEQDLVVRVAQAYFDVLAAQDTLSATSADKTAIAEQLASAKRNFEVGTATITDTREAQARFDLRSAQVIAAENDLRNKRLALDQLVGRVGVQPKGRALPVPLPETVRSDVEQWVSEADALHPQVRKARLGLDVATLETEKARATELPTLDDIARRLHRIQNPKVVNEIMEHLSIALFADRKASTLSTGNLQRLGLARALLHEPELGILDEPANGLDPAGVVEIREMLTSLAHERGMTVFMSSHILSEVDLLATRIGIIHKGKMIEELDANKLEQLRSSRLEIKTRDNKLAYEVLTRAGYSMEMDETTLLIHEQRVLEAPDNIATLLVSAGVAPTRLVVEQENLEDYFLRLIGENQ